MMITTTTDIARFGYRELEMLRDTLNAWLDHGLPDDFEHKEVVPMFNLNSGYVFLTNEECQVAMLCGNKLESFYSCPECGREGFKDDFDSECCLAYLKGGE